MILKKIFTFLLVYLPIVSFTFAQQNATLTDSIEIAFSNPKTDTVSLNRILKQLSDPKKANSLNKDSLALIILERFNRINYTDGIYRATDLIATLHYKQGNFKVALKYHKNLLEFLQLNGNKSNQIAGVYKFMTGEYLNLGLYDSAIIYGEKSLVEFQNLNDSQNISRSLNLLGGIYWNKGNLTKASEKLYEALIIREKLKDSMGVANAYNNIGLIFDSQGKLPEALEMYNKALVIYSKIENLAGVGRVCNNIAIVKKNQKSYNESLEMFLKSLEVDKKLKNIDDQGKTLNNIGLLYLDIQNVAKGVDYFNQAFDAFRQSGNENGIAAVNINLGRANFLQRNFSVSQRYYIKSLELAKKIGSNEWLRDSYQGLYQIAKETNSYKNALSYHENFKLLDDSLRGIDNLNKLDQLKIEFETNQKEKEIALLSKDNELNVLKIKKQESYSHLLLTIIVSAALIIFLVSMYVHKLKTDKVLLLQKNAEILQQNEEIQAQRDLLETSNAELSQQKEELLTQSEQIEHQNQFITGINRRMTEGLEYASLIQQTLLPNTNIFNKYFKSQFVLFKPKDIVSGDLYWAWEEDGEIIFAIADCTGHGVAGAFMSVMAISLLRDAVGVNRLKTPSQIASYLYNELVKSSNYELNSIVGIDFIICKYSPLQKQLTYSGNHLNFIIAKQGNIELIKVGRVYGTDLAQSAFTDTQITLEVSDRLYFYTDGYTDQLSGVKRKKMGRTEFQKLLSTIEMQPYYLQSEMIEAFYYKWKGTFEQVDDVLVLGLEV